MAKITTQLPNESVSEGTDHAVLKQLKELQDKLAKLEKDKLDVKKPSDPREQYKGPRSYKYNTFSGRIITDIETPLFEDPSKQELVYQNRYGEYVDNHKIRLIFSDTNKEGSNELIIGNTEYAKFKKFGPEAVFAKATLAARKDVNGQSTIFYVFNIDGEDVEISHNVLN